MGGGLGVYVPQAPVESEILSGVRGILAHCSDPEGFTQKVNKELNRIWEELTGFGPDLHERISAIDRKINKHQAGGGRA
jgi:hypothetical protein